MAFFIALSFSTLLLVYWFTKIGIVRCSVLLEITESEVSTYTDWHDTYSFFCMSFCFTTQMLLYVTFEISLLFPQISTSHMTYEYVNTMGAMKSFSGLRHNIMAIMPVCINKRNKSHILTDLKYTNFSCEITRWIVLFTSRDPLHSDSKFIEFHRNCTRTLSTVSRYRINRLVLSCLYNSLQYRAVNLHVNSSLRTAHDLSAEAHDKNVL